MLNGDSWSTHGCGDCGQDNAHNYFYAGDFWFYSPGLGGGYAYARGTYRVAAVPDGGSLLAATTLAWFGLLIVRQRGGARC